MKKLVEKFNRKDVILVVSAWPKKGKDGKNHGIAWYTEMTLSKIAKKYDKRFVVLAEKDGGEEMKRVCEDRGLILRVFSKKKKSLYPQILKSLANFSKVKQVYIHSEFGVQGGIDHFVLLVPFLFLVKAMGKRITFYSHNVVDDVMELSGHLDVKGLKAKVMNIGLYLYYKFLEILCDRIVVLDKELEKKIVKFIRSEKVIGLSMPVEEKQSVKKVYARRRLGIEEDKKILLYFGFVNWYKGADWLIEKFNEKTKEEGLKDVVLVIAGGSSYSLSSNDFYCDYYAKIKAKAENNSQIKLTGFVEEKKVGLYFGAADLVVFPYRVFMGSSGSLSQAISYEKPFMVSESMKKAVGEVQSDLVFGLSDKGFGKVIKLLKDENELRAKREFSRKLKRLRKIDKLIVEEYEEVFKRNEFIEKKRFVQSVASVQ